MTIDLERGRSPINSITVRRDRSSERSLFVKTNGSSYVVFTATDLNNKRFVNIELTKTEALAFAGYLKEMCSE